MSKPFLDGGQIVSAIVPVDLSSAANNGDWVSLVNYGRLTVVFHKAAGTAGDDPVITLKQASDNAGTGAKALNFTQIREKVGTQTSVAQFTTVSQAAANTYTNTVSAEAQGVFVIHVIPEHLDTDGGFTHVQLSVPDVGTNAQLGGALYLLDEPRFAVATSVSAI